VTERGGLYKEKDATRKKHDERSMRKKVEEKWKKKQAWSF
jgi:hypothetical protein